MPGQAPKGDASKPAGAANAARAASPKGDAQIRSTLKRIPPFIGDLAPWRTIDLDVCPWDGFWPFNPSVLRRLDGTWLCSVRCANYSMPGGIANVDPSGTIKNKNVLVLLDEKTLAPRLVREMAEFDERPRRYTKCIGYEDLRLVETSRGTLHAVSTAMQLNSGGKQEIVLLDLESTPGDYFGSVHASQPMRGAWSDSHQKNWTPYQHADELLMVYSIERGGVFDRTGQIWPWNPAAPATIAAPDLPEQLAAEWLGTEPTHKRPTMHRVGGLEVRTMGSSPRMSRPGNGTHREDHFPLRGGSQLVKIQSIGYTDTDVLHGAQLGLWLGIAHGMRMIGTFKFYWHVAYLMDARGVIVKRSEPFKLSARGIEFCAGLAIDGDRAVISFGVDDERAMLGVTTTSALLSMLRPIEARERSIDTSPAARTPTPASPTTAIVTPTRKRT